MDGPLNWSTASTNGLSFRTRGQAPWVNWPQSRPRARASCLFRRARFTALRLDGFWIGSGPASGREQHGRQNGTVQAPSRYPPFSTMGVTPWGHARRACCLEPATPVIDFRRWTKSYDSKVGAHDLGDRPSPLASRIALAKAEMCTIRIHTREHNLRIARALRKGKATPEVRRAEPNRRVIFFAHNPLKSLDSQKLMKTRESK